MPQFRYDGFADRLFRDADDNSPTLKGQVGTFSQAFVDRLTKQGHRFTPMDDMKPAEVAEAKAVEPDASLPIAGTKK